MQVKKVRFKKRNKKKTKAKYIIKNKVNFNFGDNVSAKKKRDEPLWFYGIVMIALILSVVLIYPWFFNNWNIVEPLKEFIEIAYSLLKFIGIKLKKITFIYRNYT